MISEGLCIPEAKGCILTKFLAPVHELMGREPSGIVKHSWDGLGWPVEWDMVGRE